MRFREWYYMEMGGIKTMDTSHIQLQPKIPEFYRYDALSDCKAKAKEQEWYRGIYDNPQDDPDYKGIDEEEWTREHPMPSRNSPEYHTWTNEYIKMVNDRRDIERAWRKKQEEKLSIIRPRYDLFVKGCIEEAEREHNKTAEPEGYHHEFNIGADNYRVDFYKVPENDQRYDYRKVTDIIGTIPGLFSITFKGPRDYDLTGTAGAGATKVYTQLLAAAKKLLESNNVNGLSFSPADKKMALVYRKFFEDYMSQDFIQPMPYLYIRKSFLKERMAKLPPEQRQQVYSQILQGNRDIRANLKQIQQQKIAERNLILAAKKFVGKVAGLKRWGGSITPVYVKEILPPAYGQIRGKLMRIDQWGELTTVEESLKADNPNELLSLVDARLIGPDELKQFVDLLRSRGVKI